MKGFIRKNNYFFEKNIILFIFLTDLDLNYTTTAISIHPYKVKIEMAN